MELTTHSSLVKFTCMENVSKMWRKYILKLFIKNIFKDFFPIKNSCFMVLCPTRQCGKKLFMRCQWKKLVPTVCPSFSTTMNKMQVLFPLFFPQKCLCHPLRWNSVLHDVIDKNEICFNKTLS